MRTSAEGEDIIPRLPPAQSVQFDVPPANPGSTRLPSLVPIVGLAYRACCLLSFVGVLPALLTILICAAAFVSAVTIVGCDEKLSLFALIFFKLKSTKKLRCKGDGVLHLYADILEFVIFFCRYVA